MGTYSERHICDRCGKEYQVLAMFSIAQDVCCECRDELGSNWNKDKGWIKEVIN